MKVRELFKLPAVYNNGAMSAVSIEKQHKALYAGYLEISKYIDLVEIKVDKEYTTFILNVPSEVFLDKLKYQVVLRLFKDKKGNISPNSEVKVYCNEPTFQFRDAFVYNKELMLINKYKSYLNEKSLKLPPKVTNPLNKILVVKSIIYALLFLKDKDIFSVELKSKKFYPNVRVLKGDEVLRLYNKIKRDNKEMYKANNNPTNKAFTFRY